MKKAIFIIALLLTGCVTTGPSVVSSSQRQVTVLYPTGLASEQSILDTAELYCAEQGKSAVFNAQLPRDWRGQYRIYDCE